MILEALMLIGSMCGNVGLDSRFCKSRWHECLEGTTTKAELEKRGFKCSKKINELDSCLEKMRFPNPFGAKRCWDEYKGTDLAENARGGPAH